MTSCLLIRWNCASLCQGVDIVCQKDCIMLFELARISKIFGWVQRIFCFNSSNKLHTTLDKTSTDRTRSCVPADVDVLGKTPRITWGEPVETVEGEVIEGVAEADDVQAVVLVDSSIGGEEIQCMSNISGNCWRFWDSASLITVMTSNSFFHEVSDSVVECL